MLNISIKKSTLLSLLLIFVISTPAVGAAWPVYPVEMDLGYVDFDHELILNGFFNNQDPLTPWGSGPFVLSQDKMGSSSIDRSLVASKSNSRFQLTQTINSDLIYQTKRDKLSFSFYFKSTESIADDSAKAIIKQKQRICEYWPGIGLLCSYVWTSIGSNWVQVSNNPTNPWTQVMVQTQIYSQSRGLAVVIEIDDFSGARNIDSLIDNAALTLIDESYNTKVTDVGKSRSIIEISGHEDLINRHVSTVSTGAIFSAEPSIIDFFDSNNEDPNFVGEVIDYGIWSFSIDAITSSSNVDLLLQSFLTYNDKDLNAEVGSGADPTTLGDQLAISIVNWLLWSYLGGGVLSFGGLSGTQASFVMTLAQTIYNFFLRDDSGNQVSSFSYTEYFVADRYKTVVRNDLATLSENTVKEVAWTTEFDLVTPRTGSDQHIELIIDYTIEYTLWIDVFNDANQIGSPCNVPGDCYFAYQLHSDPNNVISDGLIQKEQLKLYFDIPSY